MKFSEELDEYIVLKLHLSNFRGSERNLEPDFQIAGMEIRRKIRIDEKRLLKLYFRNWKVPYYGRLKGWREDSPIYALYRGALVSGCYLCDQNEFEEEKNWGQVHYNFTAPSFKRRGLFSILFDEAIRKAKFWHLQGVILNTDRYLLPELHMKWGAILWKKIAKKKSEKRAKIIVESLVI